MAREFYIEANSFAAPFFSDRSIGYVSADSAAEALEKFASDYRHPAGLYAAAAYTGADARNKGEDPLARWLSNQAIYLEEVHKRPGAVMIRMDGPGKGEISGKSVEIENPKEGRVVV